MRTSDTFTELAAALALAQGAFDNPTKDREVKVYGETKAGKPFEYTFKYATFTAVVDAVRKPLSENGLSFMQVIVADEHGFLITTRLLHASGQWVEFDTPVFINGAGAQAFGSGVTYAKRYALSTMLGITADEDDDANSADGNNVDMRSRAQGTPVNRPAQRPQQQAAPQQNGKIAASSNDEAAETFTTQSIEAIGKMRHQEELSAWWRANGRHIEKLGAKYPALHDRLCAAADKMRMDLPHVTQAAE